MRELTCPNSKVGAHTMGVKAVVSGDKFVGDTESLALWLYYLLADMCCPAYFGSHSGEDNVAED